MKKRVPVFVLVTSVVFAVVLTIFLTIFGLYAYGIVADANLNSADYNAAAKAAEIQSLLDNYYVGELDDTYMSDVVADAMVYATEDRWAYYVPASEATQYHDSETNSYCGVGITIQQESNEFGLEVISVKEEGPAYAAGIRVGDILQSVEDQSVLELGLEETQKLVRGEEGTSVSLTLLRDGETYTVDVSREKVRLRVVTSRMIDDNIAYIKIDNFDEDSAAQTIHAVEQALVGGAEGIVFDLRFNLGGQKDELISILDYLLPEGPIFKDTLYNGHEATTQSDASCVDLPMAVLVNAESYSASEFMAAALQEYGWAVIVGEKTVGKGQYQSPFELSDGSVVSFSIGRYYTPMGKSLDGIGVIPDVPVDMTEDMLQQLYYGTLEDRDDPQLQTAVGQVENLIKAERS